MCRPTSLGLFDELPPAHGMAPHAGCSIPGPLGTVTDRGSTWPSVDRPAVAIEAAPGRSISLPFAVGADTYSLRRADDARPLNANEESVPPSEAGAIFERAALQHRENVPLLRLLERAAALLSGFHERGAFVLVRQRPALSIVTAAEARSPAPPAPRPRPAPGSPQPAAVEEPVLAAAQAAVLKEAAALGVPFCEECARAAAERAAATAS